MTAEAGSEDAGLIARPDCSACNGTGTVVHRGINNLWTTPCCECRLAALAERVKELTLERDDAIRRMEAGWVQVCAEPAIKHFKEAAERAEGESAALREQVAALTAKTVVTGNVAEDW